MLLGLALSLLVQLYNFSELIVTTIIPGQFVLTGDFKLLLFFLSQQFKEKIDVYFFLVSFFKKR